MQFGGMIGYMQQVKELLLKNRLQISTYLLRVEPSGFTLYAQSPNLVISIAQVTPVINTIQRTHTHTHLVYAETLGVVYAAPPNCP